MLRKTNLGLVAYCKAQLGKPYWYGTHGHEASEELYQRLANGQYTKTSILCFRKDTYTKDYGLKVHDCSGLIKGYLFCDTKEDFYNPQNYTAEIDGGIRYSNCKKKGLIKSMPEVKGLLVFKTGHVGVYIGNGKVIEAKGHAYGVVETELAKGYWTSWGECPYIKYAESEANKMIDELIDEYGGDKVEKALRILIESIYDDGKPSPWAVEEFEEAKEAGITDGSEPEKFASREEVAIMVLRGNKNNE